MVYIKIPSAAVFFFEADGYTVRPHGEKVGVAIRAASGPSAQAVKVDAEERGVGRRGG